jgi:hypothetical protein
MANKPFTDLITFSRAGTATYFNSSGVLTTANTNEARYDYNPSTLVARGLLIEESKTNYISYSQNFENAYWDGGEDMPMISKQCEQYYNEKFAS